MLLVKIGGGAALDLAAITSDLSSLDRRCVVLHGANHIRNELGKALGQEPRVVESVSGFASVLTDDDAITLLMAAYAGIRNKRLVELLRKAGVNAIGLTGLDGGTVAGKRNEGIRVKQDGRKLLLRDLSGKPRTINTALLTTLLDQGYTPVLTVPIVGEDGAALNTENDEVLALLAGALPVSDVVSLMEAPGLLSDPDDQNSWLSEITTGDLAQWEERVEGRMRRKVRALANLFAAVGERPLRVRLADGRVPNPVSRALAGEGTLIRRSESAGGPVPAAPAGWLGRQSRVELDVYGKRDLTIVRGEGTRVWDEAGRPYIDCIAGHGSLNLGHRHPALMAAMRQQSGELVCCPGSFANPARTKFLERLAAAAPPGLARTFLSNSGTESVEAALKIARHHSGRLNFVAMDGGFHGRTMGALSVTSEPRFREPFEPLVAGVTRVPFDRIEPLIAALDETVAAVVVEPVQGEGGVRIPSPGYLSAVRQACDQAGALLIVDEVQTGFGRTGFMFAVDREGVVPDILCLAKSIAGGLPLGATVVREGIALPVGAHGSTFGGNPVACAVGAATLDVLVSEELPAKAAEKGARLAGWIAEAAPAVVREIRQTGLMIGIELRARVQPFLRSLQERGVLALAAGPQVLRLLPPLIISDEDLVWVADAVIEALREHPA